VCCCLCLLVVFILRFLSRHQTCYLPALEHSATLCATSLAVATSCQAISRGHWRIEQSPPIQYVSWTLSARQQLHLFDLVQSPWPEHKFGHPLETKMIWNDNMMVIWIILERFMKCMYKSRPWVRAPWLFERSMCAESLCTFILCTILENRLLLLLEW
jgi:hypothetical protein